MSIENGERETMPSASAPMVSRNVRVVEAGVLRDDDARGVVELLHRAHQQQRVGLRISSSASAV